jgi:hypothetical protein
LSRRTRIGLRAVHRTLGHHAAGDEAELRRAEHVAHLGDTENLLAHLRCQHTREGLLDVVDEIVDHVVVTQIHAFLLDERCAPHHPRAR